MPLTVPCLFGLESLVADEMRRLNLKDVRAENGRVHCDGTLADIARLNINLRCGARVLMELGSFPARDFEALFQGVYALPESGSRYQIQFSSIKDVATLYLDTSGEGLYKRGYRARNMGAPLRETLAAALVTLSRYRGKDPFCDPFCGSGTIPIEAALIAKNRAPGLDRSFAAQKWKNMDSKLWLEAADEAMDKEFHGQYDIWGGDIDPAAVELAKHNAVLAGVDDCIRFEAADAGKFRRDSEYGQLVTNPPYGERLLEKKEAEELYRTFGAALRDLPPKWRVLVLSSHTEFERCFGRSADKKRKLYNGMIKCDVFMYGK